MRLDLNLPKVPSTRENEAFIIKQVKLSCGGRGGKRGSGVETSPYNLQSEEQLCVVMLYVRGHSPGKALAELGEGVGGTDALGEEARA